MKTPINFPCVMFEKIDPIGISLTENDLLKKYAFIKNDECVNKLKKRIAEAQNLKKKYLSILN